jgi:lysophospholipase L1-like esterase
VLLLGNGMSFGWDVDSHQIAPTGQLSRAVSAITGRGCDVEFVGSESMNMRSSLAWIGSRDLSDVDALIIAIGVNDALRLTPPEDFERGLTDLLANTVSRLRSNAVVTITSIPPAGSLPAFDGTIAKITATHRDVLNASARRLAATLRVRYLDVSSFTGVGGRPLPAIESYVELGRRIAADLGAELLATRPDPDPRSPQPDTLWDWSGTEEIVELAAQGGADELNRLAREAQQAFRVELAVVSLVNGDRLYYGNNTDVMPESVPLDLSFCQYTVASGEPVIIPDTRRDVRFADNPLVELSFINFYAGYPLRATDGTVIGSFCLQGSRARDGRAVSIDELRAYALQAQVEIQRYEKPKAAPPLGQRYSFG